MRLRSAWRELRAAAPGTRFEQVYRRHHHRARPGYYRVLIYAVGGVLIAAGIVSSLLPGIPGFVFVALGGALISIEALHAARALDRIEKWLHRSVQRLRRKWRHARG
jgi:hypothetical protein